MSDLALQQRITELEYQVAQMSQTIAQLNLWMADLLPISEEDRAEMRKIGK